MKPTLQGAALLPIDLSFDTDSCQGSLRADRDRENSVDVSGRRVACLVVMRAESVISAVVYA